MDGPSSPRETLPRTERRLDSPAWVANARRPKREERPYEHWIYAASVPAHQETFLRIRQISNRPLGIGRVNRRSLERRGAAESFPARPPCRTLNLSHATLSRDRDLEHRQDDPKGSRLGARRFPASYCQTLQCDRRFRRTGRSFPHKNAGFRTNDPLVRPLLSWRLLSIRGHKPSEGGTDHGDGTRACCPAF